MGEHGEVGAAGAMQVADVSPVRRYGTAALIASCAVYVGALLLSRDAPTTSVAIVGGALGAAAVATADRRLLPQVFARAITWLAFAPAAIAVGWALANGSSAAAALPCALAAGTALLAGAPLLHTREAHQPFAPVRFRKTWIASATAAIAGAIVAGSLAVSAAWHSEVLGAAAMTALAVGLGASARAVLSMRGWGVLLGGATSLLAIGIGIATGFSPLLLLAVPGALVASPLVLSRLLPESGERGASVPRARIATEPATSRVAAYDVDAERATIDDLELDEPARVLEEGPRRASLP